MFSRIYKIITLNKIVSFTKLQPLLFLNKLRNKLDGLSNNYDVEKFDIKSRLINL